MAIALPIGRVSITERQISGGFFPRGYSAIFFEEQIEGAPSSDIIARYSSTGKTITIPALSEFIEPIELENEIAAYPGATLSPFEITITDSMSLKVTSICQTEENTSVEDVFFAVRINNADTIFTYQRYGSTYRAIAEIAFFAGDVINLELRGRNINTAGENLELTGAFFEMKKLR